MSTAHEHLPRDYRAWTWQRPGEPAGMELQSRPLALPEAGEVLIANRIAALNPVDWKIIELGYGAWQPGHVPGVDGVGVVAAVGPGVHLQVGARVAYHQGLALGGSFAQYTTLRAESLIAVPEGVSDEVAASLPCPGMTAMQAIDKVPVTAARDVLVNGAGGGVGLILTQLAIRRGWRVWTSASSKHHAALLAIGVAGAFDYHAPDWLDRLQQALGARRLYAAFDTVSRAQARTLADRLGYNGHLVCIQDRLEQAPLPAFSTAISLHEVALNAVHGFGTAQDWHAWRNDGRQLMALAAAGNLVLPPITVHPFESLPAALTGLKTGTAAGKQLVRL